jgi:hypothetical protein
MIFIALKLGLCSQRFLIGIKIRAHVTAYSYYQYSLLLYMSSICRIESRIVFTFLYFGSQPGQYRYPYLYLAISWNEVPVHGGTDGVQLLGFVPIPFHLADQGQEIFSLLLEILN